METSEFREPPGCFATGITIVTAISPGRDLLAVTASFECATRFRYDAGDRVIFVGGSSRMKGAPKGDPPMFSRGGYRGPTSED